MKLRFLFMITFLQSVSIIEAQSEYHPLKPGTVWTYAYGSDFDPKGDQISQIMILDNPKTINGQDYTVLQTSLGTTVDLEIVQLGYLRITDDGKILGLDSEEVETESIYAPKPPLTVASLGLLWQRQQLPRPLK